MQRQDRQKRQNLPTPDACEQQHTRRIAALFLKTRELGLDKRGDNQGLMEWIQEDPSDTGTIGLLEERVVEEEQTLALHPDPFRANACWDTDRLFGPVELGNLIQTGWRYGIPLDQITRHLGVFGRTQGGKTTVLRALYRGIKCSFPEVKILILETKQQFTDIAKEFGFKVLCSQDLRINLLRAPPGIAPHVWLSHFTQTMVNYMDIMVPTSGLIIAQGMLLLKESGVIDDPAVHCPHLGDLAVRIANQKFSAYSHYARHQETALTRIEMLMNALPAVFECDQGLPIEDLLRGDYLIMLDDVPQLSIQNFMKVYISSAVFLYRMIVEGEQDHLRNIIGLDEASSLFRRTDEVQSKASYLANVISQSAAFGIGIVGSSQYTTDLSHTFLANTGTKILVGGFERDDDGRTYLASRPHSREQADAVKESRQPGRAFVSDLRHTHFIECQIDLPDLPPRMTREEVRAASAETARELGLTEPGPAETPNSLSKPGPAIDRAHESRRDDTHPTCESKEDLSLRILRDIYNSNFEIYTTRTKRLNMSRSSLKAIIERLQAHGLIRIHHVHDRAAAPRDLYEITDEGYVALDAPKPPAKGKGGYLHQFYQDKVSRFLQAQGYRVKIEGRADAKEVDIVAVKQPEGETVAVEIELNVRTSTHFLENARMDLKASRIDRVLFLVPTKPEIEVVEKAVGADPELSSQRTCIAVDYIRNHMDLKS